MAQGTKELVYIKITKAREETVVAVCDAELLGKKLDDRCLDICFEVRETFYKGLKIEVEDSIEYLKKASIINLTGARIVRKAVKSGIINPSAILRIAGVPHAQAVKM